MNLSVSERYALLAALPAEGSFTTLKIVRKLRESLSFSEAEVKEFQLNEEPQPGGGFRITWSPTAAEKDINIGEKASDIVSETLKKLDQEGKLTDREYSLYEKFVESK